MVEEDEIRSAVHSMYSQQYQQYQQQFMSAGPAAVPPPPLSHHSFSSTGMPGNAGLPRSQSHMVNLLSEDFIAGYMDEGRMSVVRRFFCLFVTFDVVFISLLWIICVMITGDNIVHALQTQVVHYTIYTSLFDVVVSALLRFLFLILFYGLCHLNHWIVIALSTTGSCAFLIYKVFVYNDEEFKKMGVECVRNAYELLESMNWKVEKITSKGDTIQSCTRDKIGKIYKLTAKIHYPAKKLLQELYYKIEDVPKWNPTLLESKIIRKIDSHTDISYQATIGGGGGVVKCRDFVNLRCWQLCRDGRVIEGVDIHPTNSLAPLLTPVTEEVGDNSGDNDEDDDEVMDGADSDDECILEMPSPKMSKSCSEFKLESSSTSDSNEQATKRAFSSLSKSLGAQDFQHGGAGGANSDPEDVFSDALTEHQDRVSESVKVNPGKSRRRPRAGDEVQKGGNVYVSAAISIDYPGAPCSNKYIRGENKVSCWAMREIDNQKEYCIFEWLLCLDLKGYIPRYVLDTAYTTLMQDYMTHLRNYVTELRKQGKVPAAADQRPAPNSTKLPTGGPKAS